MFRVGFEKIAATSSDETEPQWKKKLSVLLPAAAGLGVYTLLRRKTPLPKGAPKELKALRQAAEEHGMARVHLHDKKPGAVMRAITEVFQPADKHIHLTVNRGYVGGKKTKMPVFDPEDSGYFKTKHPIGKADKTTRAIDKSKLDEYKITKALGIKLPETKLLQNAKRLKEGEIIKPLKGSQARVALTSADVKAYNPDSLALRNFKAIKGGLAKLRKSGKLDVNEEMVQLNHHPGYKMWMVEQALKNPEKFIKQPKIDIAREFRVHTLHGKVVGRAEHRHTLGLGGKREAEQAAEKLIREADPKLKSNLLALDIAKDRKGKWHIIETNPGPESGFLTPTKLVDFRGPHALYKAVTGRRTKTTASAGAGAAAGVTSAIYNKIMKPGKDPGGPYTPEDMPNGGK